MLRTYKGKIATKTQLSNITNIVRRTKSHLHKKQSKKITKTTSNNELNYTTIY